MTLSEEIRAVRSLPSPELARAIRMNAGVTQARLAEEVGVTRATINRWESGERRPQGRHRATYAAVLAEIQAAV